VRGWSAYYRSVVSARTFNGLDRHLWQLTWKWACYRHCNKPKRWIAHRYYGQFHPARKDQWVFGDRDSGAFLLKFSWTRIIRHDLVKGTASPGRRSGTIPAACSVSSAAGARPAAGSSCTPTISQPPRANGNNG
jgi:hypothetical protein